jgi:hypothetical protein
LFTTSSLILKKYTKHQTYQVRAWKKRPQNSIKNENASNKTTNIKNKFENIGHLIAKA